MSRMSSVDYLLEHVAQADGATADRNSPSALTRYYTADGYPPAQWLGTGVAGLNHGAGLDVEVPPTELQMRRLFERGEDPVTGEQLARRPPRTYRTRQERIDRRVSKLPATMPAQVRTVHIERIKDEERKVPTRNPVAGFDLTFSVPKSVSVLWAVADHGTSVQLYEAHREAVTAVLGMIEVEALRTRIGTNGVQQVTTRGAVATAFDHWDSRAGDPQLHTHVTIANRVQGSTDGRGRTIDSRALYRSAVAFSERYNLLLADAVSRRTGLAWELTDRGPRRSTSRELAIIPADLAAEFSQRSAAIEPAVDQAVTDWTALHGRPPLTAVINRIRQTLTLDTRTAKQHHSLGEMTAQWHRRATDILGTHPGEWATAALRAAAETGRPAFFTAADIDPDWIRTAAARVLTKTSATRSVWTHWNLDSQTGKYLGAQNIHFATAADLAHVAAAITDTAEQLSVDLTAPGLAHTPAQFLDRATGRSQFTGAAVFTSLAIIDAEARLLAAGQDATGPAVRIDTATRVAAAPLPDRKILYAEDQAPAAIAVTTSGRRVDLLLGPAGTGKTTSMAGVRAIWEAEYGPGTVRGLATTAQAAAVLAADLGMETENTAKWLAELSLHEDRTARLDRLVHARAAAVLDCRPTLRLDEAIFRATETIARWQLRPGDLLIVDEAGMAGTLALDRLAAQAAHAGAKLLLVGDPHQLAAVETGGALGLLAADRGDTPTLNQIRRFREPDGTRRAWEEAASTGLRLGPTSCLTAYEDHDRFVDGPGTDMLAAAYEAWRYDTATGKMSLLIAADNTTVTLLNQQARAELVAVGQVDEVGVSLADGSIAGRGDRIVTREIDRVLSDGSGHGRILSARTGKRDAGFVRNGQQWQVQEARSDGSLTVRLLDSKGRPSGRPVTLPAHYVAEHVQLGYATTAHRSQGLTVDTAHTIAPASMTREAFYVAMTRGKLANHAYLPTDTPPPGVDQELTHHGGVEVTRAEVLAAILANSGADVSAHQTMAAQADQAESIEQLAAEYETIAAAAHRAATEDAVYAASALARLDVDQVLDSPDVDELHRAVRAARAAGLPVDNALPGIVEQLPEAGRTATGLAESTRNWTTAVAAGRTPPIRPCIAGLLPVADMGITDPGMRTALTERAELIEARADAVLARAEMNHASWLTDLLARRPADPAGRRTWHAQARIVAAYRDRRGLTDIQHTATLGPMPPAGTGWAQLADRRQAEAAVAAISGAAATSAPRQRGPAGRTRAVR